SSFRACSFRAQNFQRRLTASSALRRLHSQTMRTLYPIFLNSIHLFASRERFATSFLDQKSALVFGTRAFVVLFVFSQFLCPCQKHPFTKIAHREERFATSGDPGRSWL